MTRPMHSVHTDLGGVDFEVGVGRIAGVDGDGAFVTRRKNFLALAERQREPKPESESVNRQAQVEISWKFALQYNK